jgi:hypothetical protein
MQAQTAFLQRHQARGSVECARLISEITGGTHIDPTRLTIAAFLDQWLDERTARAASRPEGGRSI